MIKVRIEPIIPKKQSVMHPAKYQKAIEAAGNESALAVRVDFRVTTQTWQHKPDFKIVHGSEPEWEISTDDKIYGYVSEGTPPHVILPKNAKRLVFYRTGFRPKSRVGWIGSNKGKKATKDLTFAKKVNHPGIAGRKFSKLIKEKWDAEWPRQLQRAIRAAAPYGV